MEFSVRYFSIKILKVKFISLFSHDEWVKLDRVIERKDITNANILFQHRPRRTSQINTNRQQHLDSTNSNEQNNQQPVTNSSTVDITSSTSNDDDEQNKHSKIIHIDRHKNEESDIDDNSQGQGESTFDNYHIFLFWNNEVIFSLE